MRIAVLGTGPVGRTLATRLADLGHDVALGSRTADNGDARAWVQGAGGRARHGTFAEVAAGADLLVNATGGGVAAAVLASIDAADLRGKVLLDVSNPLDFSDGAVALSVSGTDSVAEQLQRAHPDLQVVKSLNTVTADVMVAPGDIPGDHLVFLSGDSAEAKAVVAGVLQELGWRKEQVTDLGGIRTARATEAYVLLWVALYGTLGGGDFNIVLARR